MTDKTTTTALLPCPMCDAPASFGRVTYDPRTVHEQEWTQDTFHYVNCSACGVKNLGVVGFKTQEDASAAWNRRASPSPAPAAPSAAQPDYSHLRPEGGRFSFAYSPDTELPWVGWRFDDRDAAHFFRMELDALRNEEIFPAPAQPAQDSLTETAECRRILEGMTELFEMTGEANIPGTDSYTILWQAREFLSAARAAQPVGEVVEALEGIATDTVAVGLQEVNGRFVLKADRGTKGNVVGEGGSLEEATANLRAALRSGEGR